uniref:Uncharacterized protein n=1 Tax=Chaetoceros debilis TaxID=122233 RepID=A0A7S3VG54_9STRA|mmetsp:Transcript_18757/g.28500  ORF Transcript_18757/g.28500 Transcript_18757/m.28500 type:complete len:585 (+) Transcript_18757:171-1925(+)|eukprot:CAMPEP_0194088814 /NCGR_PEP_ID=MMETSP0149-20130528/31164_1 /TAXON_ID=122233 /ORGANISM="Chaetoceros debilis, Strain MM31A-1" /LENGTH=584 /DNA_ID=CAMNT_0038772555 /DNA_START=53 /DNA_END=1807 /DNA_ORIENTATION=+
MSSSNKNAFAMLMSGSSGNSGKKRKRVEFVECPSCKRSFASTSINIHLDKCIMDGFEHEAQPPSPLPSSTALLESSSSSAWKSPMKCTPKSDTAKIANSISNEEHLEKKESENHQAANDRPTIDHMNSEAMKNSTSSLKESGVNSDKSKKEKIISSQSEKKLGTSSPNQNAFQHMMQHSKIAFTQQSKRNRREWFHLSAAGEISWMRSDDPTIQGLDVKWSGSVMINSLKTEKDGTNVELNITSSIPSAVEYQALVQRTSKFSVPVLKSVLQKGVRRRRPLPSVRSAMELSDKSFGDLIRRLPIICLEDSFLHHDFPFFIWLMVAYSKDFVPPQELIVRIMRAVFEIASCPWRDELNLHEHYHSNKEDTGKRYSLTSPSELSLHQKKEGDLMLRSLLLRQKYGGMKCDLVMLDEYVQLWATRYSEEVVDSTIIAYCLPKLNKDIKVRWEVLPQLLHPIEKSLKLVPPLVHSKLRCLQKHDITSAGVDSHCSNVLDLPLADSCFCSKVDSIFGRIVEKKDLTAILKSACWENSAGKNLRRAFNIAHDINVADDSDNKVSLKHVWDAASPIVNQFVLSYIESRLVK